MKRTAIFSIAISICTLSLGQIKDSAVKDSVLVLEPVEVRATRAGENSPFTRTNLFKKEIEKVNLGADLPFILNQTPSVVVNSDAGNGVGYTGIRIRGTDASRINVTLNGVPFNDPESQGTFFVDIPDFSSSVGSIQIQRGVGTSTNGAGALGASINISTNEINTQPYLELNNCYGSFNTWKNTLKIGSGLVSDHFTTDFRLSRINSDGYIDRATTDLNSYYLSTAYIGKKNSLRLNLFSGKENTYQAWYGVGEYDLSTNRTINYAGMERPGDPYDNETDNYKQDHYQLFFNQQLNSKLRFNIGLFYIRGKGYYEQYKADEAYADYNLPEPTYGQTVVTNSDLVRQLWLDNDFYGNIFSFEHKNDNNQFTLGGSWNRYDGNHYGDVIWAKEGLALPGRWYDLSADKNDFTIYFKQLSKLSPTVSFFYDLQYRHVKYDLLGFRNNPDLFIYNNFNFFNPKIGLSYQNKEWSGYISYSRGQKEPNRDDFEAGADQQPKPEKLNDFELGTTRTINKSSIGATIYYMSYTDQLVLTGKINDVGAYTRTNIPKSYRTGIEIVANAEIEKWLKIAGNFTYSINKVSGFAEYIDDYDNGGQKINQYSSTDIAFSPDMVGAATVSFIPLKNAELSFISKYVSKQYLDNTQNESRKLNAYYTQDLRLIYTIKKKWLKELNIFLQANNILDKKYEPNGYTFSYIYGGNFSTENYYFPMAGRNYNVGLNLRL